MTGNQEVGDYDTHWESAWDSINEENMKIIEDCLTKEGWDSEESSAKEFLDDNHSEVIVAISNAQESAMRDEEYSYMYNEIEKVLHSSNITFDRADDKVQLTLHKSTLWDYLIDGETELSNIVEIDTVYYPRYGLGYDDKNFNDVLKEYLGDL
jgi:hypothetical protein